MTVSRVLAGHSVKKNTRERVEHAIEELGYVPDAAAGALSSGYSAFVAVLVPSLSSSNFSDTVRGLNTVLSSHGLQLLLGDTNYHLEQEEQLVRSMLRHQPRCIALTGGQHTEATRTLLRRAGIPVVEMWDLPVNPIGHVVGFSNAMAARAMVRHLYDQGYRRIGFLAGASELDHRGMERIRGYVAEVEALQLGVPRVIKIGESPITMSHGAPAITALLEQWPDTQAVMCVSDMSACGAIMECQRRGLSVPDDIAIAGFGNFEVSWCCHPTITTVSVDAYGIGLRAGEILLATLGQDKPVSSKQASSLLSQSGKIIQIDYSVISREST